MPRESQKHKRLRAARVLNELETLYPDAVTELEYRTPFELLVATILSAQATDKSVNAATPSLFERYPNAEALAQAEPEDIAPYIRKIGLYRSKAKNLVGTARMLAEDFGGEVPSDFKDILKLPGVGRKTANVVLSNVFGRPAIAVDTHVGRLARRLGFSGHDNPDKVEKDLEKLFPEEKWVFAHHALILHGRRVCFARNPDCRSCPLSPICPSSRV